MYCIRLYSVSYYSVSGSYYSHTYRIKPCANDLNSVHTFSLVLYFLKLNYLLFYSLTYTNTYSFYFSISFFLSTSLSRVEVKNSVTGEIKILFLTKEQETEDKYFKDATTGATLDVLDRLPLVEWFADHYKDFGAALEFVSNKSQEGSQFVRGFGGIGGILRWQVNFMEMEDFEELDIEAGFI